MAMTNTERTAEELVDDFRQAVLDNRDFGGWYDWERYLETRAALLTTLRAKERVGEAARALLDKLDLIHADPRYLRVWELSQLRDGAYTGPTYKTEADNLRAALTPSQEVGDG